METLTYRRVSHLEEGENRSPVVGDGNITDIVHEHLVESARGQRCFATARRPALDGRNPARKVLESFSASRTRQVRGMI